MWYAVYITATGQLISVGSVLANPLPAELSVKQFDSEPDAALVEWDIVTLSFIPHPLEVDHG